MKVIKVAIPDEVRKELAKKKKLEKKKFTYLKCLCILT